ncbi:DUF3014 domain-containing protein [Ramlibacter tataouinensis]|uniref:DUF3014 domain-containing protein n=1 Tax=Ramlibacter tataouinensis TaxID=94132 RepID=UPI0022F3C68A|nr:DUF3014 domain-containing protein [Ramlibacter tataouinensis]WBY02422.1 DUF3014 domain-containing protein [Ramlibacter tataouinensis]
MFRPDGHAPRNASRRPRVGLVAVAAVAIVALLWYDQWRGHAPAPAEVQAPADPAQAAAPAGAPAIEHPLPEAPAPADFTASLRALAGRQGMALLRDSNFPAHFVATVDNLAREHAPPAAWPVLPTPGRFATRAQGNGEVIAEDNAKRYAAFVDFVDQVDTAAAVNLYIGAYPMFQQAWRDLGMGQGYFNDRLVAVIDLLLRTPEPTGPLAVKLLEIKGPHQPQRPWVRYEFADEQLQGLAAGQKILLRMAPDQRRRLKAKLVEFRRGITGPAQLPGKAAQAGSAPVSN